MQCSLTWAHQCNSDLASEFRLLCMDMRGHGMSEQAASAEAYQDADPSDNATKLFLAESLINLAKETRDETAKKKYFSSALRTADFRSMTMLAITAIQS